MRELAGADSSVQTDQEPEGKEALVLTRHFSGRTDPRFSVVRGWKSILLALAVAWLPLSCARSTGGPAAKSSTIAPEKHTPFDAAPPSEIVQTPASDTAADSEIASARGTAPGAVSEGIPSTMLIIAEADSAERATNQPLMIAVGLPTQNRPIVAQSKVEPSSKMLANVQPPVPQPAKARSGATPNLSTIGNAPIKPIESDALEMRIRKRWSTPFINAALICLGVVHLLWGCRIGRQGIIGDCIIFGLILGVARVGLPGGVFLALWLSVVAWFYPRHALVVLAVLIASYMTWIGLWVVPGGPGTYGATILALVAMIVGFLFMVRMGVMDLHGASAVAGSLLGSALIITGVMQCSEALSDLMLDIVFYLPLMVVALTALGIFYQLTAPGVNARKDALPMPRT